MFVETVPKHNISPSTRFFPKERYEIFDGKMLARKSFVEKIKIFVHCTGVTYVEISEEYRVPWS